MAKILKQQLAILTLIKIILMEDTLKKKPANELQENFFNTATPPSLTKESSRKQNKGKNVNDKAEAKINQEDFELIK